MASIDKIYATRPQHEQLHDWLTRHRPDALSQTVGDPDEFWECLDSAELMPISNFDKVVDMWLQWTAAEWGSD